MRKMKNHTSLIEAVLVLMLAACSLLHVSTPLPTGPATGSPPETQTPPLNKPTRTRTPWPVDLPTLTPTSTPEEPLARPKKELLNCRFGPGTVYVSIGVLKPDQTARIAGRNVEGTWWYIHDPGNPDGFCWVSMDLTETSGDLRAVPVVGPPVPSVTGIDLTVSPNRLTVTCSAFPQVVYMTAQITVNGPALVTWRWEASTGVVSSEGMLTFEESGTRIVRDYYKIGAPNDYWIRLHVLGPNDISEQANFLVLCNP
jgi:hypothetical protein